MTESDQLPASLKNCTIEFKECNEGHGRLVPTNWIDHGCDTCAQKNLKEKSERLRQALQQIESMPPGKPTLNIKCRVGDPKAVGYAYQHIARKALEDYDSGCNS